MKAIVSRYASRRVARLRPALILLLGLSLAAWAAAAQEDAARPSAAPIFSVADTPGGLIVHLGCGDGRLTVALRHNESCVVQGLQRDSAALQPARELVRKQGLYGPVSIVPFAGAQLPYADNLVNLVVAEDLGEVPQAEVLRVLAPGGTLCRLQHGQWTTLIKPRPANIDQWTHFLHDAGGNAVAHDERVAPPDALQWTAGPRYTWSHEHIPGLYALVSAGGRIFYLEDDAPAAAVERLPQWQVVARDAFNGIVLWKKAVPTWFPHLINWGQTPPQLQRRLVSVGDRLYVTLGWHAPLSALDAASGATVKVYDQTEGAEEVLWHQGTLLLVIRSLTDGRRAEQENWAQLVRRGEAVLKDRDTAEPLVKRLRTSENQGDLSLVALDAQSGRPLWTKTGDDVRGLRSLSLCADAEQVCYQTGKDVVCLDLHSGQKLWSASAGRLFLIHDGNVVCANDTVATVFSAATGEKRWQQPHKLSQVHDVFVAGGALWVGGFKPFPHKRGPVWGPYFATELDLKTGAVGKEVEPENPSHHHRCYPNKATDHYILGGRRGTEFIDLASGDVLWNSWARGVCRYGVMPCNGLLYVPPHACACYMAAKLIGFNVLAGHAKTESGKGKTDAADRREEGPAFDALAQSAAAPAADWPTYRHDAQRSGVSAAPLPAELRVRWTTPVGSRLTPPTVAEGRVFAASIDDQRVCALDADSGKLAWQFTAGARVDSPPTIDQGRALFGCRDGWVYSVRTADGALAWRSCAARRDRRIMADGQLESVSPVPGSVIVHDGVAYCTAGRSSYLDGGIDLLRLDARSGKHLSRTPVYSPDPDTGRQPAQSGPASMPGAREDVLSSDAGHVYLRELAFDLRGAPQEEGNPHLFAMTAFRDDAWAHRSYWIFGRQCSVAGGCSSRDKQLIYGRLLAFDASTIYGYGRATVHWSNQFQDGPYRLFATDRAAGQTRWEMPLPIQVRSLLVAGAVVLAAGPPAGASVGPGDLGAGEPSLLLALSAADGKILGQTELPAAPVFDGLAAAGGRLYACLEDGRVVCLQ